MNSVIAIAAPTADEADITVELTKAAEALSARYPLTHPELQRAAAALSNGQAEPAGAILSRALERRPDDPDALHLMAQAAMSELQYGKAEGLLLRCLRRSPHFELARFNYAKLLLQQNKTEQSIRELEFLLAVHTGDFLYRDLKALALSRLGRHAESAECYRRLTDDYP